LHLTLSYKNLPCFNSKTVLLEVIKMKTEYKWVILITLLALLLRSSVLPIAYRYPDRVMSNDSPTYIDPARQLIADGYYTYPSLQRTPLYPMFLALVLKVLGTPWANVIAIQTLISTFNVFLTYLLARKFFSSSAAIAASLFLAIGLESIANQFFILTETVFTTLFLGSVFCFVEYKFTLRWNWLVSAAILMGLSILCRPIAIYFPVIILIFLAFLHYKEMKELFISCGIFLIFVSAVIAPWYFRSYVLTGKPILSTINNYNLLFYNAASLEAELTDKSLDEQQEIYTDRVQAVLGELKIAKTERDLDDIYGDMAKKIILEHPAQYIFIHLKYDVRNFLPGMAHALEILAPLDNGSRDGAEILRKEGLSATFSSYFGDDWINLFILAPFIIILFVIYIADFIGVMVLVRRRRWFVLGILLLPIAYYLLIPGAPSNSRFRVPVMPYMSILAGVGIISTISWIKGKISAIRIHSEQSPNHETRQLAADEIMAQMAALLPEQYRGRYKPLVGKEPKYLTFDGARD
jgi:4-amino-4-deoxy-L-arabinose transferase-like glycosyltransferase